MLLVQRLVTREGPDSSVNNISWWNDKHVTVITSQYLWMLWDTESAILLIRDKSILRKVLFKGKKILLKSKQSVTLISRLCHLMAEGSQWHSSHWCWDIGTLMVLLLFSDRIKQKIIFWFLKSVDYNFLLLSLHNFHLLSLLLIWICLIKKIQPWHNPWQWQSNPSHAKWPYWINLEVQLSRDVTEQWDQKGC